MKKFIKGHRYTCVLLLIFILLVILGIKAKDMLVPDEGKPTYGDRLKEINKHPLTESDYKKVDDALKSNKSVIKVSHRLQGKTLNYFITFDSKTSVKDAKSIGENVVKNLSEDALGYYSVQISLIKEDEALNNFPIMGMKHPEAKEISWTKDREIVTESDDDEE